MSIQAAIAEQARAAAMLNAPRRLSGFDARCICGFCRHFSQLVLWASDNLWEECELRAGGAV